MKSLINDEFFSRLESLSLNLSPKLSGFFGGKHRVSTYGQTVEFSDYREYQLGDDIRRIDWNLYSRFEKFFIKLFTDERQMHLQTFIDCSASMGKSDPRKGNYAVAVAAALGFLSVHNMDKASYRLVKGNTAEDLSGIIVGKQSFFRAVNQLENISYVDEANLSEAIIACPDVGSKDGLTVIISDFMGGDWKKAVDYLVFKKRQVMLVQILTPDELDPSYSGRMQLQDIEAGSADDARNMKIRITKSMQAAYDEALRDFKQDIKDFARSREADYICIDASKPIEKVLFGELLNIGLMG
ncbi:MAG: DUF58 domain-containing protein [Firmicutes bacterium]|nr:DUF58 domain-containing protein [Bacillota bacterium]